MEKKRVLILAFGIIGVLILFILAGQFTGYQVFQPYYGTGGFGGGGGFSLIDLYLSYPSFFDFVLFLLVFIGLGQMVFADHLASGGKVMLTGLGIMLALALVLWEERSGFFVLEVLGPYLFLIVIIALVISVIVLIRKTTGANWLAVSLGYILFYLFFMGTFGYYGTGYTFFNFIYYAPFPIFGLLTFLFVASIFGVFYGFYELATGGKR